MFGYKRKVSLSYGKAVERAKEEMAKEGFGAITEIDVKATLKKKLDVEFDDYLIIGACNPGFAYKALLEERDAGLMMPCNVVVYSLGSDTFVGSVVPTKQLGIAKNKNLIKLAGEMEKKLKKVIDSV